MKGRLKGDAEVHTANPKYRAGYDRIFGTREERRLRDSKPMQSETVRTEQNGRTSRIDS